MRGMEKIFIGTRLATNDAIVGKTPKPRSTASTQCAESRLSASRAPVVYTREQEIYAARDTMNAVSSEDSTAAAVPNISSSSSSSSFSRESRYAGPCSP